MRDYGIYYKDRGNVSEDVYISGKSQMDFLQSWASSYTKTVYFTEIAHKFFGTDWFFYWMEHKVLQEHVENYLFGNLNMNLNLNLNMNLNVNLNQPTYYLTQCFSTCVPRQFWKQGFGK